MAQVDIRINGYPYSLGCADGEEDHLRAMADKVEEMTGVVKATGAVVGEARTLVMAALLLADRVSELEAGAPAAAPAPAPPTPALDPALLERLVRAAEQAERIAEAMETT